MSYTIEYESSFTYSLTGWRMPRRETRATLASAEKRALVVLHRMGAVTTPSRSVLGGPDGMVYLDGGPTLGASICRD